MVVSCSNNRSLRSIGQWTCCYALDAANRIVAFHRYTLIELASLRALAPLIDSCSGVRAQDLRLMVSQVDLWLVEIVKDVLLLMDKTEGLQDIRLRWILPEDSTVNIWDRLVLLGITSFFEWWFAIEVPICFKLFDHLRIRFKLWVHVTTAPLLFHKLLNL